MIRNALLASLCFSLLFVATSASAEKEEKKRGGGVTFTQFNSLAINVASSGPHLGVMTVEIGIDAPDSRVHDRVEKYVPRLRAAYADAMVKFVHSYRPGSVPDAEAMSRVLQSTTDQVLGMPGAKLLLGTILING